MCACLRRRKHSALFSMQKLEEINRVFFYEETIFSGSRFVSVLSARELWASCKEKKKKCPQMIPRKCSPNTFAEEKKRKLLWNRGEKEVDYSCQSQAEREEERERGRMKSRNWGYHAHYISRTTSLHFFPVWGWNLIGHHWPSKISRPPKNEEEKNHQIMGAQHEKPPCGALESNP